MSTKQFDTLMLSNSLKGYYLLECSGQGEWGCGSVLGRILSEIVFEMEVIFLWDFQYSEP